MKSTCRKSSKWKSKVIPHFMGARMICVLIFTSVFSTSYSQSNFYQRLADSAFSLTRQSVIYDPTYFNIRYPDGDVPPGRGVCTDVVIRAYRKLGIDLQKDVHTDMKNHFDLYPKIWGRSSTDRNIDHRRVPNLMMFFKRHGIVKPITSDAKDYVPGDIVCWNLKGAMNHIGILSNKRSLDGKRYLVIHNIGQGQVLEDILFKFRIIGHYTYKK